MDGPLLLLGRKIMILDPILDLFRGKAITIPPLDGPFRPNTRLDDASAVASLAGTDNLVTLGNRLFASGGNAVYERQPDGRFSAIERFNAEVTALAATPAGGLAIALDDGSFIEDGRSCSLPPVARAVTALAYAGDGALWLASGSATNRASQWSRDLLERGASGSLWYRSADGKDLRKIKDGLAFPQGLLADGTEVIVSESWRHRLLRIAPDGKAEVVLDKLPGYPARLAPAQDGGSWLALFAPRNRLIEFVLRERDYRQEMLETVHPDYWIAPALASGESFLEPLQCGAIKTMGIHKPWAPSRSYGLVVRLDATHQPLFSHHSRSDGHRHGIRSIVEWDGTLVAASRGAGELVALPAGRI